MKIGDVAKHLDIPSSTIRYYEKKGLIDPPERVSGKRDFNNSTLMTLRFIQLC
ncbi:MAG: DNA-binding transcriptional MerR regulator [Kiritimatiellia bacterium]|jgi:DNA-binding transcriptional MerR regulator